ncbi:hypothetical protein E3A20_25770, partial [Planctomyces bekefii]
DPVCAERESESWSSDRSVVRGPYKKNWREYWLQRVLETQSELRNIGPKEFSEIELITIAELQEIRRIWRFEKHEFDDAVPNIYRVATGKDFPVPPDDGNLLRNEDWEILREVCGDDPMFFELQSTLLDVEREFRGMARRAGIYEVLEDKIRACQFESEEAAVDSMRAAEELHKEADRLNEQSLFVVQKSLFPDETPEKTERSE